MDTASTLCRRFSTMRLAVSGRAMAMSFPQRAEPDGPERREGTWKGCRRESRGRRKAGIPSGQIAAMVSSMEANSPTVSPRTATLMDGVLPAARMREDTMYTQPTRATCSRSWAPAGTPAFFMP